LGADGYSCIQLGRRWAAAIAAARTAPGQVATLILPADKAWNEGNGVARIPPIPLRTAVASGMVDAAARILRSGEPTVILLGDASLRADGLALAGHVAAKSGAQFLAQTFNARVARGASRVPVERVPYFVDLALAVFKEVRHVIWSERARQWPSSAIRANRVRLTPPGCNIQTLATPHEDLTGTLGALARADRSTERNEPTGSRRRITPNNASPPEPARTVCYGSKHKLTWRKRWGCWPSHWRRSDFIHGSPVLLHALIRKGR
jgi:acetolactate synthase-1/2/3 large subunit